MSVESGLSSPKSGRRPVAGIFRADDYPQEALKKGEQGTTAVSLDINGEGRVSRCSVARSSGSSSLDEATCQVISERAQFEPARDANGSPTLGTYHQAITWRLED